MVIIFSRVIGVDFDINIIIHWGCCYVMLFN